MSEEHVEYMDDVLDLMNFFGKASTLQHVADVYGLTGMRLKGIVIERDHAVIEETRRSLRERYPEFYKRQEGD